MELFKWNNTYSVNNEKLDNHHKTIINIINWMHENCLRNDLSICLDSIVKELVSYSNYHFSAEENYMRSIGSKNIDKQTSEHKYFKHRVLQLKKAIRKSDFALTEKLIVSLGYWVIHHVINEDQNMAA